jgi:hypothetical protein
MDEEPLKIDGVAQDPTDPRGETFIMCFNRGMTPYERATLPILFSSRVARTNITSPDTVTLSGARTDYFTQQDFLYYLQRLVDEAQALALKWLTDHQFDDIVRGLEVELEPPV